MTYEEALAFLHGLQRFGIKPGLERTVELLRRLGRPDRRSGQIIHITGTSGKGSVAAMAEAALRAAGHRVGLFTSPSVTDFTDRIQVDRVNISPDRLAALVGAVRLQADAMVADGCEPPTEFEVITATAFLYYAERQTDWLVLEAGLGGRFDSTTAVEGPVITCITNIGLDHTEWLGSTHEEIAGDKAGILKPATPCVTGTHHAGALAVIREAAMAQDAVLVEVDPADARVVSFGPEGQLVDLLGARGWYRSVQLSLLGRHQAANAAVALRVLELAGLSEAVIRQGLANVLWPARFEIMQVAGRTLLLDAAHNQAKCEALAEAIHDYFPGRPVRLVLGVLADKQVAAMVAALLPLASSVVTVAPESPRALPAGALLAACAAQAAGEVRAAESVAAGLEQAIAAAGSADLVVVTGSFYTVGPARRILHTD